MDVEIDLLEDEIDSNSEGENKDERRREQCRNER